MTESETRWSKEWPAENGRYWAKPPYLARDSELLLLIEGDGAWISGRASLVSHDTFRGYEFLGPITPADTDQLVRLREAASDALKWMEHYFGEHAARKLPHDSEVISALRNALGTQENSNHVE